MEISIAVDSSGSAPVNDGEVSNFGEIYQVDSAH
jgi:hypothetical protein